MALITASSTIHRWRVPWSLIVGLTIVLFWIVVAVTIDFWAPYDPFAMGGKRLDPPSPVHWLGTDALGRDVLTRTLYGAQYSVLMTACVVVAAVIIGSGLGALSGFLGRSIDAIVMRIVDIVL